MAIIKKFAENLTQNLTNFQTFLIDENPNSTYFRITEFKDSFTGGKNGFLIEGSEHLKESTEIKIQILDVNGDPIYYEPGNGIPEYYEGISKLVAVYIYEDTPIGEAKITILGELKTYIDEGGVVRDVPNDWKGVYNLKWEKSFKVNRLLSNEDKVRFYKRPEVAIDEIVKPIFSNIVRPVTQTGFLNGTPQVPSEGENISGFSLPTSYLLTTINDSFWTGSVTNNLINLPNKGVSLLADDVINARNLTVSTPYNENGIVLPLTAEPYSVTFNYIEGNDNLKTALTGSFAKIKISDLTTFVGDCARVKIFRRSQSDLSDFQFVQEIQIESNELLRDLESNQKNEEFYGSFDQFNFRNYWLTSSNSVTTQFNQNYLFNSVRIDTTQPGEKYFTSKSLEITEGSEYTLAFNLRQVQNLPKESYFRAYLSGSTIVNNQPVGKTQNIVTITGDATLLQKQNITANFKAESIINPRLYFEVNNSGWHLADVSLRAAQETAFSPDEITFIQPIPRTLPRETFDFRFQFYDINNNYIPVLVEETKTFDGGNLNVINKDLQLVPSSLYFQFDSGSGNGNPIPPTQIFIDVIKNFLTGSVTFTSRSFDFFNNELFNTDYVGVGSQYPGLLLDRNTDTVRLTVENFTGSRADKIVQYIEYTGECEGITDSIVITRVVDGKGGVNHIIRPFNGTQIRNSSTASLEIQAIRIDGINEINLSSGSQYNWGNIQLHVLSSSLNPIAEPDRFINLAAASASRYIKGLRTGSLGSKEINYNAIFDRDSIDTRRTVFLLPYSLSSTQFAYQISGSVLATILLEDLQDGLDTPSVIFNSDTFAINPRLERVFRPQFAFATASFYKRGTTEAITSSFQVFPSMSINRDFVPEYWLYYTTQSTDRTISVVARDENKNIVNSLPLNSYIAPTNRQSKNLTITFTYTEPYTSASISVDKTFSIIPEGKPGDESIVFEINPAIVNLKADAKGNVNSYSSSVSEIRLKQGSRYLNFTASKGEGTFFIVNGSITGSNIIPGNIINPLPPGFNRDWTGSLFIGAARSMNNLSGSVTYNVEIQPYYTSSIYTASIVQQFTKTLDGAPQLEVILTPANPSLNADEVGFISDFTAADTIVRIKEGNDFLLYNTSSQLPGTFFINNFVQNNIQTASFTASMNTDNALVKFHRFEHPFTSASVEYNIVTFPYSLGPGHNFTSSIVQKTQNFTKVIASPIARGVSLVASTNVVNFDKDGIITSPESQEVELTATAINTTGSVWYEFYKNGISYTGIQSSNQATIASGDATLPGETAVWTVAIRDGSNSPSAPIRAEASVTVAGIQEGIASYNANLTNDNVSIVYRVSGELEIANTGTTITATKGQESLTHVSTFSPQTLDVFFNEIGSLGEYQVTIHSKSAHLTLAGNLVSQSVVPTVGGVASIGNIVDWANANINPQASVVYRIDFENGKGVAFKTQSFSVQFEGNTGPGIVMRGQYSELFDYIGSYETTNFRRDAVIYPDPSGSSGVTHYFAALSGSGPNTYVNPTTSEYYVGNTPPGGFVLIGHQYPPAPNNDNDYWQYLGEQDFFVAAKIAIFDESFVKNTVNIGNNPGSSFANIVLAGGRTDPYLAIGQVGTSGASGIQTGTGVIGYDRPGIFLGMYENPVPNGTSGRFSISNADGSRALKWDGSNLTLVGSIRQVSPGIPEGSFRGAWVGSPSTTYYVNDTVTYNGASYICLTLHNSTNGTGNTGFPNQSAFWTIFAASGTSGLDGTSGTSGASGAPGANGAGVVYRGRWVSGRQYFKTTTRQDVVQGSDGQYYLAKSTHTSATGQDPFGGGGITGTPAIYWESFGATFSSVATDILFAQDVFANRTINVGEGAIPAISLNADAANSGSNPFISIGQFSRTGSSGYDQEGIFLGMFSGSARMSLKSSQGVLRWTGNTLEVQGTVRATDGQLGAGNNVWKIDNALLYSSASVGQIQLNANRPSIEIYDNTSNLRVDINSNTTLSPLSPFNPPISASATPNIAQGFYNSLVIEQDGYDEAVNATMYINGMVSSSASPSSASFYAPTSAEGLSARIDVEIGGNFWGSATIDGSGTIRYGEVAQRYGVRVFWVPETYTGPEEEQAYYTFYSTVSQFYPGFGPLDATLVGNMNRTVQIPLTLKGGGFYRIQTFADEYLSEWGGLADRDIFPLPQIAIFSYNDDQLGIGSPAGSGNYGPTSPTLDSVSVTISTSKTEIIAGGMQVAFSSDRYVSIPRTASGPMMKVAGGLEVISNETTGITSPSGSVNIFNEVFSPNFTNGVGNTDTTAALTNGYSKLTNGMWLQAGYVVTGGTGPANAVITFPLAFPNDCLAVTVATNRNSSGASGYNHVTAVSRTGATAVFDSPGDGFWIAVGH